jgi:hypothetical protein
MTFFSSSKSFGSASNSFGFTSAVPFGTSFGFGRSKFGSTATTPQKLRKRTLWTRQLTNDELIAEIDEYIAKNGSLSTPVDGEESLLFQYCEQINTIPLDIFKYIVAEKKATFDPIDIIAALDGYKDGTNIDTLIYLTELYTIDFNISHPEMGDSSFCSILVTKCDNFPLTFIKYLIAKNKINFFKPSIGETPLGKILKSIQSSNNIDNVLYLLHQITVSDDNNSSEPLQDNNKIPLPPQDMNSLLSNACSNANNITLDVIKYLIDELHADINHVSTYTPLALILINQKKQIPPENVSNIVSYLLTFENIDVTHNDMIGGNLLHQAVNFPIEIVKKLVQKFNLDIYGRTMHSGIPLHCAISSFQSCYSDVNSVLYLLQKMIETNNEKNSTFFDKAFSLACDNVNNIPLEVFEHLIKIGVNVNITDYKNDTPIHNAVRNYKKSTDSNIIYYLLKQVVNINHQGGLCQTILSLCAENIKNIPLTLFEYLIDAQKADIAIYDMHDNLPIHHAFMAISPDDGQGTMERQMRNEMIEKNNQKNDKEINKIDLNKKILFLLKRSHFDDINRTNFDKVTLLHIACEGIRFFDIEIYKYLIEILNADINSEDARQETPINRVLEFAGKDKASQDIVMYFLSQKSINIERRSPFGSTPFVSACKNINNLSLNIFQYMINVLGFQVNSHSLATAVEQFNDNSQVQILQFLLSEYKKIDPNNQNDSVILSSICENYHNIPIVIFDYFLQNVKISLYYEGGFLAKPIYTILQKYKPRHSTHLTQYLLKLHGIYVQNDITIPSDENNLKIGQIDNKNIPRVDENGEFNEISVQNSSNQHIAKLSQHVNDQVAFVQYIVSNGLIPDPINGNKYLSLLCNAVRPSFCAIKLFCDGVKIDFFSQNLDHTHFNHKNPIQYLPLIGLSNKRVNIDKSNDGQITIDHNIAEILEYIIEASILSF